MIWACVEDDRLEAESRRLARQLAATPSHAILDARAIFAAAQKNSLPEQLALERVRQMELLDGESFTEGVRSFVRLPSDERLFFPFVKPEICWRTLEHLG